MPASAIAKESLALAQNPVTTLGLTIGEHKPTAGTYIGKAEAQSPPTISFTNADPSKTYLAACLDLDPPFVSFAFLGPILHWIQPGFKLASTSTSASASVASLNTSAPVICSYIAPRPPPGSGPHRYLFMLYEQPDSFDAAKFMPKEGEQLGVRSRMRCDWDAWVKNAGLEKPVAANWFTSN